MDLIIGLSPFVLIIGLILGKDGIKHAAKTIGDGVAAGVAIVLMLALGVIAIAFVCAAIGGNL